MSEMTAKDYEKMTVLQLRDLLKQRGLTTTGTKNVLISRLLEPSAGDEAGTGDSNKSASVPSSGEDLLRDDAITTPPKTAASSAPAKASPVKSPTPTLAASATTATPTNNNTTITAPENSASEKPSVNSVDAKLARAARFGLPLSGEVLKHKRAERFGINVNTSNGKGTVAGATVTDPEVLRKRAERYGLTLYGMMTGYSFGLPIKSPGSETASGEAVSGGEAASGDVPKNLDKLAERAKRFGISNDTVEMELKKKARLERFGPA